MKFDQVNAAMAVEVATPPPWMRAGPLYGIVTNAYGPRSIYVRFTEYAYGVNLSCGPMEPLSLARIGELPPEAIESLSRIQLDVLMSIRQSLDATVARGQPYPMSPAAIEAAIQRYENARAVLRVPGAASMQIMEPYADL